MDACAQGLGARCPLVLPALSGVGEDCKRTSAVVGPRTLLGDWRGTTRASLSQVASWSRGLGYGQGQRLPSVAEGTGVGVLTSCCPLSRCRGQDGARVPFCGLGSLVHPVCSSWRGRRDPRGDTCSYPSITLPGSAVPAKMASKHGRPGTNYSADCVGNLTACTVAIQIKQLTLMSL